VTSNPLGIHLTPEQRDHRVEIIRKGREDGLTWEQMGQMLDMKGTSLESWYNRNHRFHRDVAKVRPCMCCKKDFPSEGNHNRLCLRCRSERVPTPWETVVGGSRRAGKL
jgi:hypothetical protein